MNGKSTPIQLKEHWCGEHYHIHKENVKICPDFKPNKHFLNSFEFVTWQKSCKCDFDLFKEHSKSCIARYEMVVLNK